MKSAINYVLHKLLSWFLIFYYYYTGCHCTKRSDGLNLYVIGKVFNGELCQIQSN